MVAPAPGACQYLMGVLYRRRDGQKQTVSYGRPLPP